ncbi:MAG TPA: hypothetical protein VKR06_25380 [Ktedonosporobacter sp.]|nr:hypothetical protein [Ktedonosporobacter sp.]
MPSIEPEEIVLGPGNEIVSDPQNEQLLALLLQFPIWEPDQVLKLAQFYQAYPGNASLGKHVALVALATQAGPQVAQQALQDYIDWEELGEVITSGSNYDAATEANESFRVFYRRVPVNGIGLLVETFLSTDKEKVESSRHFILGIAPAL